MKNFPADFNLQTLLAQHLQQLRKQQKLSRAVLEKISTVPAPARGMQLQPTTIEQVLADEF